MTRAVDDYLALRRAAGYRLVNVEQHLRGFAHHAVEIGDTHVRIETSLAWAARASSPAQRERRLESIARFARHARAEDARHEVPSLGVFADGSRPPPSLPHIFSMEEIRSLIAAASRLPLCRGGALLPLTYQTLFGLLAVTGLRISEALALRLNDVTVDGLVIRNTKFRKSRLVPLHQTTTAALEGYLDRRCKVPTTDDHVFISVRKRALCYSTVRGTFRTIIASCGFQRPSRRQPRIHDLRHTFAVRALEACPLGSRKQIDKHIVALSTYLGHTHLRYSYWYFHATPRLMADVADACEALEGGAP